MPEDGGRNFGLTKRELEIARAYAGGQNYKGIAAELCIAPSTVRTHITTIYRKLGVKTKIELLHQIEPRAVVEPTGFAETRPDRTTMIAMGVAVISLTALIVSIVALTVTVMNVQPPVAAPPELDARPAGPQ